MVLEFCLAASQLCLIGLDFVKTAANFRRLLCRHPPVLVKFDRLVSHNRLPFPGLRFPIVRSDAPEGFKKQMLTSPAAAYLRCVGGLKLVSCKDLSHSLAVYGNGAHKIQPKKQGLFSAFLFIHAIF